MENQGKNAIKWINKLLKTRFKQGRGKLGNKKDGFCCLGLGCHILDIDYDLHDGCSVEFSESVGLLDKEGYPSYNDDLECLINLNDDCNSSFRDIGKILIENPFNYFNTKVAEEVNNYFNKN